MVGISQADFNLFLGSIYWSYLPVKSQYAGILHKKLLEEIHLSYFFIELCSYIIENDFNNVQTTEIHKFTQVHSEFQ